MAPTLQQLLQPVTADEAKALLLSTLSGIGPVQQVGQGSGTVVVTGSPVAAYDVVVQITTGGTPGSAAFQYSLDDGVTFSGTFTVPSNGTFTASGTGLVFNFAGNFNQGDQYLLQTVWPPFPVTDWESGSGGRTFVEADAAALADLAGNALPDIAAGGFVDYAPGISVNPGGDDWLSLLSHEVYENDRFPPGPTVVLVALTLAATASALTINPGDLTVANGQGSGSGVRTFQNTTGATINPGTTAVLPFQATQPGSAYNVQNNTLTVLQTPRAGLTCNNPAPGTSSVTHTGSGSGTVTTGGTPNGNFSVVVRITLTGGLGAGAAQVSLDGGNNYASPFTIPAGGGYVIPTQSGTGVTGLTITFAGSFVSGDTYAFTSYAQSVTTPGVDEESDQALQARDKGKWSGLGFGGGTAATFDYLARNTPSGGSEVTKTYVAADFSNPSQVDVVVAGANGPVSASALAAITAYVAQYTGICVKSSVQNASTQTIHVVAQVFVKAQQLSAAQTAIANAFAALVTSTPIAGKVPTVAIEDALYQPLSGVTDVFLTSPPPNTDTQLPAATVVLFDLTGVSYVLV